MRDLNKSSLPVKQHYNDVPKQRQYNLVSTLAKKGIK
jgi:hypothetical protein